MTQADECELISDFANAVIKRHRNPTNVIRALANLMSTMAVMLDDQARAVCADTLRDCADLMERDIMKRMGK